MSSLACAARGFSHLGKGPCTASSLVHLCSQHKTHTVCRDWSPGSLFTLSHSPSWGRRASHSVGMATLVCASASACPQLLTNVSPLSSPGSRRHRLEACLCVRPVLVSFCCEKLPLLITLNVQNCRMQNRNWAGDLGCISAPRSREPEVPWSPLGV